MTGFIRQTLDARTWTRILYLLLALPLGVVEVSVLVTAISFGFGTEGTYFWPAWVMLGSAASIAIKALPQPRRAHAQLLGDHS